MKKLVPLTSLILLLTVPSHADVSKFYDYVVVVRQNIENITAQETKDIQLKQEIYGEDNINGVELTALCILGECPDYDVKCIGETHDKCAASVQRFLSRGQESSSSSVSQEADQETVQDTSTAKVPDAQKLPL